MYQILVYGDKSPLKEVWSESRDPFFKMLPQWYLCNWWSWALQITYRTEYECMHDILHPTGMCL